MPSFVHPALLYALPLVAVPVIIHWINRMRQNRVQWAAMEFLLESYRRHRTWVLLQQLLLLLLRMVAIAVIVLMVAQPVARQSLAALLGGARTHHIVLLDDSYSMSDRVAGSSVFNSAVEAVRRIGQQAGEQNQPQEFTLLRLSRATTGQKALNPDLNRRSVDDTFRERLEEALGELTPSEQAASPSEGLAAAVRLAAQESTASEAVVVHLVSDFRARDWQNAQQLRASLERLEEAGAQIRFVACADAQRQNLGLVSLKALPGLRAAGINLRMEVAVKNYGPEPAKNVSVLLAARGLALPALNLEAIDVGETATQTFEVRFNNPGAQQVTAQLADDALPADNKIHAVLDLERAVGALVVDGSRERLNDSFFLSRVLAPDPRTPTGVEVTEDTPQSLRDKSLAAFQTVYLLNVDRLDQASLARLEEFVRSGGGLGVFLGENTDIGWFNEQFYREGAGPFPLPLVGKTELLVDRLRPAPDLQITDHPIFARLFAERNSDLDSVVVSKYVAAEKSWSPPDGSSARVIARLRNGAPLAVEQRFGRGVVVAFLTTAGPTGWNNWGRSSASYVLTMLELQAYLAASRNIDESRQVGAPIELAWDAGAFQPTVRFTLPGDEAAPVTVNAKTTEERLAASLEETSQAGFYEAELTRADGSTELRSYAVNVMPQEGDLRLADSQLLADQLEGVDYTLLPADRLATASASMAGLRVGDWFVFFLVLLLLGEQCLAYFASYHAPSRRSAA